MKKRHKRMNQKRIDNIKVLVDMGLKMKQISPLANVSQATLSSVKKANYDFNEYRLLLKSYKDRSLLKKESTSVAEVRDASSGKKIDSSELILTELRVMNNTLKRLADAWEKKDERRGLFK